MKRSAAGVWRGKHPLTDVIIFLQLLEVRLYLWLKHAAAMSSYHKGYGETYVLAHLKGVTSQPVRSLVCVSAC